MTSPVPVKRAKRSRTLASATPVSSAISESSRWPYFCRHCRMSIKVSLPLLDAIVAMNPGDENLHLTSAARHRHGRWCHMSSLRAPSDTLASRSTTRWRSRSKLTCNLTGLVATAEPDGRRPATSCRPPKKSARSRRSSGPRDCRGARGPRAGSWGGRANDAARRGAGRPCVFSETPAGRRVTRQRPWPIPPIRRTRARSGPVPKRPVWRRTPRSRTRCRAA
jgi:hypothetical protein